MTNNNDTMAPMVDCAPAENMEAAIKPPISKKRRNVAEQNTVLLAALSGAGRRPSNRQTYDTRCHRTGLMVRPFDVCTGEHRCLPPRMTLTIKLAGEKAMVVGVANYREASVLTRDTIEAAGVGGSGFDGASLHLDGKLVGHVSYNGRVWEGTARAWTTKTRLLWEARGECWQSEESEGEAERRWTDHDGGCE